MKKFNPITKKDISNIAMRGFCYEMINDEVCKYEETVSNKVFDTVKCDGFDEGEMEESYLKLYKLEVVYKDTEDWLSFLFMNSMFLISGITAITSSKDITFRLSGLALTIICGIGLYKSIHNGILRSKIKKNFKEFNIN